MQTPPPAAAAAPVVPSLVSFSKTSSLPDEAAGLGGRGVRTRGTWATCTLGCAGSDGVALGAGGVALGAGGVGLVVATGGVGAGGVDGGGVGAGGVALAIGVG